MKKVCAWISGHYKRVADYADRHIRRGESAGKVAEQLLNQQGTQFEPQAAHIMAQILQEK